MQLNLKHNEVFPYRTSKRRTNKFSPRRLPQVERLEMNYKYKSNKELWKDDRKMLRNNINIELEYML
jgi:hypothetical protein